MKLSRLKKEVESANVKKRKDISDSDKQNATKEYGNVEFADKTNKKYPIDNEEHIRAAWNYINKEKNANKYDDKSLQIIKNNIINAWKKKIDKNGPTSAKE
jgi:hypothetical protein